MKFKTLSWEVQMRKKESLAIKIEEEAGKYKDGP